MFLKRAWKDYKAVKKIAGTLRKDFLQGIVNKLALEQDVTSDVMRQIMLREAKAIQQGWESRQLRGRNYKDPVHKTIAK